MACQTLDQKDREIFDLKLKIHFLTLRLEQQSPQTHSALEDENMQLKVAYGRLKAECKKNKKYSLECVKVIEELKRELDNVKRSGVAGGGGPQNARSIQREAELNDKVKEERERRRALEEEVELLKDRADKEARAMRDSEVRSPGATSKQQRGDGSDRDSPISFPSIQAEIERLQKSNAELEQENEAVHDHAEAAKDELRQVRDELDRKEDEEHSRSGGGGRMSDAEFDELRRRAEDLEDVRLHSPLHQPETCESNALLRSVLPIKELEAAHTQLEAQKTSIETFKDEREELLDEREELHKQLDRVEGGQSNRSMSRAGNEDFDRVRPPSRSHVPVLSLYLLISPGRLLSLQERNELRDRLASAGLELEKKESLLEEKERALQEAYAELDGVDQQWADEVKVTKAQNEELKDVSRPISLNR